MALCSHCHKVPPLPGQRACQTCHAFYQRRYRKATKRRTIAQVNLLLERAGSPLRVIEIGDNGRVFIQKAEGK